MPSDDDAPATPVPDLPPWSREPGAIVTSPARRAHVVGARVDERLRPWNLGRWTGRSLTDMSRAELSAWREDCGWSGHGGESLQDVGERVADLLSDWHDHAGGLVAVTHASVVRAAVLLAMKAPLQSAWDLDVRPGSWTVLHAHGSGWRVRSVGCAG